MPKAKQQTHKAEGKKSGTTKGGKSGNGKKRTTKASDAAGESMAAAELAAAYRSTEQSIESNMLSAETIKHYVNQIDSSRHWFNTEFLPTIYPDGVAPEEVNVDNEFVQDLLDDNLKVNSSNFQHALDDTPNEHTPGVIRLLIKVKCFHEGKSISTANLIRSAFKWLYWKYVLQIIL
jgi:hypothetical protein